MTAYTQTAAIAPFVFALSAALPANGAAVHPVHRFVDTGPNAPSHYALGSTPYAELVQASDGNFYGTAVYGGSGLCPNESEGGYTGCGTIFRMTPTGTVTVIYSFPYDTRTNTAPDGAFPTAGLIQGQDGYLYGVAQDGGIAGCNGGFGCGTLFRVSTSGTFKLLHQFCNGDGCMNPEEGGRPMAHLVQLPNGQLCGTTAQGGIQNEGTLFCASTAGGVNTRYVFRYENGTDGYDPVSALLVGPDGQTLYGATKNGGVNGGAAGGGIVFALKGKTMKILHAFDNAESPAAGTYYTPLGAPIFGADGKLYGITYTGGSGGGCIYSLSTDGSGFTVNHDFNANASSNAPGFPVTGLVLARDGIFYGTTLFGSIEQTAGLDNGVVFRYDLNLGFRALADFTTAAGTKPRAALIEGADRYLYGTASADGGSNSRGTDAGTTYRLTPPLKK